ncbi:MAG: type II toxin-antitoxin system antitoxin SocA domain-containing protein [Candidatus Paceibacterota bacterium]|jgi:transcriptional regulator with XRE-family HTH domain
MSNKYAQFIKMLRTERNFSQSELAIKLGMSRPSYIAIEQGKKEITLSEAEKISEIFGVSLREMESGISANYKKYKQMILSYIRNAGSKKDGCITKTKLAKLLYLADFAWFYNHLESMSGMQYRKIQYGPVPDSYFRAIDELFEDGQIKITPTEDGAILISQTRNGAKIALSEINEEEEKLIKSISKKWKGRNTKEIVTFTHNQLPYAVCLDNEIIPYELITQENPEDVY